MALSLESERLLLRPFAASDLEALLSIQSHPEVARWLYWAVADPGSADGRRRNA